MFKMQKISNLLLLVGRDQHLVYFTMLSPQGVSNLVKMTNANQMSKVNKLGTMELPLAYSNFQAFNVQTQLPTFNQVSAQLLQEETRW